MTAAPRPPAINETTMRGRYTATSRPDTRILS